MKSQLSFAAVALVLGTAALGFATGGFRSSPHSRETASPVRLADAAGHRPQRIYCYTGMRAEKGGLTRGWVCEPDPAAAAPN